MANLIKYKEENIDVLKQPLQYIGSVAADMKLVQSNCLLVTTSNVFYGVITSNILSYEGTAIPYIDNGNLKFSQGGTFYNLVLTDGTHYPIAEGANSYISDTISPAKTLYTPNSSYQWVTQDTYHYNINNGFNDLGNGVKLPYPINGEYTNPKILGHNGAETKITMEAFREYIGYCEFHYDQNLNYQSNILSYNDIVDTSNTTFVRNINPIKFNIETFYPGNASFKNKRFKSSFYQDIEEYNNINDY